MATPVKPVVLGLVVLLMAQVSLLPGANPAPSPAPPMTVAGEAGNKEADKRIAELIRQLGDPQFARRQQAERELRAIGPAAKQPLIVALSSPDAEVRLRAQRILIHVLEADFEARVEAFARGNEPGKSYDLPCWEAYRRIAGDLPAARQLFADALRAEPVLLEAVQQDPKTAAEAIVRRCDELSGDAYRWRRRPFPSTAEAPRVSAARMSALLLAACAPDVAVDEAVSLRIHQLFHLSKLVNDMTDGAPDQPARRLLGAWIQRTENTGQAFQGVWLAMRFQLPEGLGPAASLLKQKDQQAYARQMAILAIGKLGSRQHVLLLEPLLTDDTLCEASPEDEKARYRCEVRDVALAVIIHLHAQKPKDFGFERIQGNSQSLFNYNSMGFASTEQRQKALAKWKQWLASNAAKADANLKR